ncbi:Na/Pi cotransporter family protein [Agrobacterium vitis]|uniref:Na/Pi cotransporter family protein n=1 Tax=Agrobacterium vitis TaxID=373 RepID=A0AAE4WEU5_AGRVI|nr:Na/Pi symporter [Agrobacterium vitis]MCF1499344.1 Na/Pi cotransporter family protein [Allorhizobium sp. Av2]MCM2439404.1 Na/Pi cotransporter family protein [Agrobacterium vitis]MUZ57692.1 hypothetical protein [Agrobacterium vitis]
MSIFATIFAGLGLFFIGVKLIGGNLRLMAGRGFRAVIGRAVARPSIAAALGVVAGALTQSTNAVTFICINTVAAGLVQARQILPVMIWANVGTCALVLLAALDVHLLVLLLIGTVGLLYYLELDKSARFRHLVAVLLGVGLLFFGIDLIRDGADGLRRMPEVQTAINYGHSSFILIFLIGVVITVIAQSSSTVTVVAAAMAQAGVLDLNQAIIIVYGAGLGSGIATWLMAAKLSGTPKRLVLLQTFTKSVGIVVLVPLLVVEMQFELPLARSLVEFLSPRVQEQIALVYVLYQLISAFVISAALDPFYRLIQRLYPETMEESLFKPQFVYAGGDIEAETGALLVEKEQQRLVGFIRDSLDHVRADAEAGKAGRPKPQLLHQARQSVGSEISAFIGELMGSSPPRETMEHLAGLHSAQGLLDDLGNEVHTLVMHPGVYTPASSLASLINNMIESLHLIVTTLFDELEDPEAFRYSSLLAMTSDRSDMMGKLRRDLIRGNEALGNTQQETLFTATTVFEHSVWLVRRYLSLVNAGKLSAQPEPLVASLSRSGLAPRP